MTFVDIIDDNNLVEESTKEMLLKLLECAAEYENVDTEITEMSLSFVLSSTKLLSSIISTNVMIFSLYILV